MTIERDSKQKDVMLVTRATKGKPIKNLILAC